MQFKETFAGNPTSLYETVRLLNIGIQLKQFLPNRSGKITTESSNMS